MQPAGGDHDQHRGGARQHDDFPRRHLATEERLASLLLHGVEARLVSFLLDAVQRWGKQHPGGETITAAAPARSAAHARSRVPTVEPWSTIFELVPTVAVPLPEPLAVKYA